MKTLSSGLLSVMLLVQVGSLAVATPAKALITIGFGVGISIGIPPPLLPVYEQPVIPGPGYIWVPGHWAYDEYFDDFYWVPGTWVRPPRIGWLWTPGYWGLYDGYYVWNPGYWGRSVGFYGGIDYGFGYTGVGYSGGYWAGRTFRYNTACNNVGRVINVRNVYNQNVLINNTTTRQAFTGIQPTQAQINAARAGIAATHVQTQHFNKAHQNAKSPTSVLRARVNGGKPSIAATAKPSALSGSGIVAAKQAAPYVAPPKGAAMKNRPQHSATPRAVPAPKAAPAQRAAPPAHRAVPAQHAAPPAHRAVPTQRAAPPAHRAVPAQHAAPPAHRAVPAPRAAPPAHRAVPAQRAAPPAHRAVPTQHAAPPAHRAVPAQRAAPPAHRAVPVQRAAPAHRAVPAQRAAPAHRAVPPGRGGGGGKARTHQQ